MPDRKEYMRQYRLKKKMQNSNKPVKRAKTAAEHQKEYRARKKAKKLAAAAGASTEDSIKIVKTAAEYQREYRARMKASKPRKTEDDVKIVKTAAEYQREYRARIKATKPRKSENSLRIVKTAAEYQREYRARLKAKKLEAAKSMSVDNIKKVKTAAERQRECRRRKKAIILDDAETSKSKELIRKLKAAAQRQKECREMLRKHILYRDACLRPLLDLGLPHCSPQYPALCSSPSTPASGLLNIVSPKHLCSASNSFAQPWASMQNFFSPTFNGECGETPVSTGTIDQAEPDFPAVKSEPQSPHESGDEGSETCFSDVNVKTETNISWTPTINLEVFPELPVEFEPRTKAEEDSQGCFKIDVKLKNETSCSEIRDNLPRSFDVKSEPSSPGDSYQEDKKWGS